MISLEELVKKDSYTYSEFYCCVKETKYPSISRKTAILVRNSVIKNLQKDISKAQEEGVIELLIEQTKDFIKSLRDDE